MSASTPPPPSDDSGYGQGAAWAFSAEGGFGEVSRRPAGSGRGPSRQSLDPLSGRLLKVAGLLAVLLLAVLANAALHGDGDALNPVAEAAQRTERAPGARLAVEVTYSLPGQTTTVVGHADGAYDARSGRTELALSFSVPGRGTETMRGVGDDRTVFMRSPAISAGLPPGKPWLAVQPLLGHGDRSLGSGGNAKAALDMLNAAGENVENKGQATVRGHLTTLYAGTIHLGQVAKLLEKRGEAAVAREYEEAAKLSPAPIPVEVWVDENGLARRLRIVQQLPASPGEPAPTMDMEMELFDFGARPKIALPPRDVVLDATPLVRAELHLLNGETLSSLTAPSRREPMSAAEFRHRGNAICRDVRREAKPLARRAWALIDRLKEAGASDLSPPQRLALVQRFGPVLYRPISKLGREALGQLSRLSPPAADSALFARSLRGTAVSVERFEAQAVAVEVGAMSAFKRLEAENKAQNRREDSLARKLGLRDCIGHHEDEAAFHSETSIE